MIYKLLVVDDEPANLRMLERLLRADYDVLTAASGGEALELLSQHDVALIITDQRMPGMTGIEFLKQAAAMRVHTVRIILTGYTDVSDLVEAINSGLVYRYITKPWVNTDLQQSIQRGIEHYEVKKTQHLLTQENDRYEVRLRKTLQGFVGAIREMIAQKNPEIANHCRRTSNYAVLIGEKLNLDADELEQLVFASLIHEVSSIKIPFDFDMNKTFAAPEQFRAIRNSFESGIRMISRIPDLEDVATIIRYQHERYDGKGLFDGLNGEKIPLASRILSVANSFDEIISGRNPAFICTDEEAADWMRERAGSDFDPEIVEVCLEVELSGPSVFPNFEKLNERSASALATVR